MTSGRAAAPATPFERGAARALQLAPRRESATALLRFAAGLLQAQGQVAVALQSTSKLAGRGRLEDDVACLLDASHPLLAFASAGGPAGLAEQAREFGELSAPERAGMLQACWRGEWSAFLARALLRPYLVVLAAAGVAPDRARPQGSCPACGGRPSTATRRPGAEGEGVARFLVCGTCGGEWPTTRIGCPACGEATPERLSVFRGEAYPEALLEACDACRAYLKCIDASVDPSALAEIDDLASTFLDLWAVEQGYRRIEDGLAGPLLPPPG